MECSPDAAGVTKVYELTYESIEVVHALFDRNTANNHWTTNALFLKDFSEHFGPKAEQLDIYLEDGKVTFMSFTDKVVNSKNGE
jgi:cell cycle checkpoint control protein RAD9A